MRSVTAKWVQYVLLKIICQDRSYLYFRSFSFTITYLSFSRLVNFRSSIGLITVFDAIWTSRQPREKLQCLYENLRSNNFRKTALRNKTMNCKLKLQSKGFYYKILGALTVLKFLQTLASDLSHICPQFFPGKRLQANVWKILKSGSNAYSCM